MSADRDSLEDQVHPVDEVLDPFASIEPYVTMVSPTRPVGNVGNWTPVM
jgi:hypothetical protein